MMIDYVTIIWSKKDLNTIINLYISKNLNFPKSLSDIQGHKNNDINPLVTNHIVVSKRVKSIRQLRNSEKEWVRLCYKEAMLKGITLADHIQFYIATKTKIWIEKTGLDYIRKSEEIDDKKWYYHMAKDHFVYIAAYRKCIDELELVKKECWKLIMNSEEKYSVRIQALRETHSITQTLVLLLRDLPFVANLSKYYDPNFSNVGNKTANFQQLVSNNDSEHDNKELIEQKVSERLRKMLYESGLFKSRINSETDTNTQENENTSMSDSIT